MEKETDILKAQIPIDVLKNLRTDDVRILRKIAKSFSNQERLRQERQKIGKVETPHETMVKLLKNEIRKGKFEIRTLGGAEAVATTILKTRTAVSIVCPDFETEEVGEKTVYKSGGEIKSGIGLTGKKILDSLDLINKISELSGGLDLFIIYQASAEEIISLKDKENIQRSSLSMQLALTNEEHNFNPHFMVMDFEGLTDRAREISKSIILKDDEVSRLSKDREEIIRMRLGIVNSEPLSFDLKRQEATFDIATHLLSESVAKNMTGHDNFVHFTVDSARFSKYYNNPAISIGRNIRYKGD